MNIVSLRIKNFLSISDVEIKPGQINQIVGDNNQGKTSIIKAIEFAVKGSAEGSLVKFGEENAEVILELDDLTTIKRKISANGKQTVDVKKEGFKAPTPQTYLDAMFETSAFNPLELLDPKRRNEAILSSIPIAVTEPRLKEELGEGVTLPPLDYSKHGLKVIDQAHKYFYGRRAEANKDLAEKKKRYDTYLADLPKPDETVLDRKTLQSEIDAANAVHQKAVDKVKAIAQEHASARAAMERVKKYQGAIADIDADIVKAQSALDALRARREEGLAFVNKAQDEVPTSLPSEAEAVEERNARFNEMQALTGKMIVIDKNEAVAKQREMVEGMKIEFEKSKLLADRLTGCVELLGGKIKSKLMSEAEMPIQGLMYKDEGFFVDGVSVDNLSSSKALRLAVGVARKLAKKTKIICLDGAECLDEITWKSLHEEIKDDGYTYFVTKVGGPFVVNEGDKVIPMGQGAVSQ